MFKNVLVGVDARPNSLDAIALASRLAHPEGKVTLAHVHSGELRPSHAITPGLVEAERGSSHDLLETQRAKANVQAELISIVSESPGRGLHQQAENQNADLLVVGSCGYGAFGRAMLGDDTRAALNGAPCAVAVASLGYAEHPAAINNIGVAYNGSPESENALAIARKLATRTGAKLHALEVVSIPSVAFTGLVPPAIGESIDVMLAEVNGRMHALGDIDGQAVYGLPGEELAAFSGRVNLLVVGSRGYGPVKRLMLGSTSDYLERHARCPLLVLPRGATNEREDSTTSGELQAAAQ